MFSFIFQAWKKQNFESHLAKKLQKSLYISLLRKSFIEDTFSQVIFVFTIWIWYQSKDNKFTCWIWINFYQEINMKHEKCPPWNTMLISVNFAYLWKFYIHSLNEKDDFFSCYSVYSVQYQVPIKVNPDAYKSKNEGWTRNFS